MTSVQARSGDLRPPDVFLIGVPRSGTTSLYHGLGQHSQVFAGQPKEACFACSELDPGTRRNDTAWFTDRRAYLETFRGAQPDQRIVEGCVYNIYSEQAPRLIRDLNPDARILVQLRDPIEQMRSNHGLKLIMLDLDDPDFGRAVALQDARRNGRTEPPSNMRDYDLRDKATVGQGLRRFVDELGRARVHVTVYEEFAADPAATFRSIFGFMGVDESFVPEVHRLVPNREARSKRLNRTMGSQSVTGWAKRVFPSRLHPAARRLAKFAFGLNRRPVARPPIDDEVLSRLRSEFRSEVALLSELTGHDLFALWWNESRGREFASPAVSRDPSVG